MSPTQRQLRLLYSDIVEGHSIAYFNESPVYIKHLNNIDIAEIDYLYNFSVKEAVSIGLPTQEEKTKYLIENNLWEQSQEDKLDELIKTRGTFSLNKGNEYLRSKRKMWDEQIKQINNDIRIIEYKKASLLGMTAESYANKKSNDEYIKTTFYSDKNLKKRRFENEDYYSLSEKDSGELFKILNEFISNFSQDNIKRISLSSFFSIIFSLCPENITDLYGKPVIYLTLYQTDVFNWARYFRNMISNMSGNLPPEMTDDPDKLMEYLECNKQYKKVEDGMKETGTVSLMGAKKEDLEILGLQAARKVDLNKELKKRGGSMSGSEMMDLGLI